MAERMNGNAAHFRRTHGSERRGVTPTPDLHFADRKRQSRDDKVRVLELIRERYKKTPEDAEVLDLGNKTLPAYKYKTELVANIETHKAVIVGGETGSGKSTQLPQYLYEAGYDATFVLVPRRIIANGLGERIRSELSEQITDPEQNFDEIVGIVHGERSEQHEKNRIIVMTPNTFIKMEPELRKKLNGKKVAIIADEIHEANLFTEIAVGVAAMAVRDQESWRLVAASATHNADTLRRPFERINNGFVPTVEIEGRPFEVELQEEPELTPPQAYARDGWEDLKTMIFTSGKKEIRHVIDETRRELEKIQRGSSRNVVFRMLHGELTKTELSHINNPVGEGQRLVIVSSPAGMSGITIPGVTRVITDGTINRSELDDDGASGLKRKYLSRAGIKQQIGRAGRDVPGGIGVVCAPMFSEEKDSVDHLVEYVSEETGYVALENREAHEPPEIYNTNLASVVLEVAAGDRVFSHINDYIPNRVQPINIITSEESLARLGALDDDDKITPTGRRMEMFPVRPELGRGLVEATLPGRSLQHMARAAFVAAAFDVGGIIDNQASEAAERLRRQIIRRTSHDDLMVQLDLMSKLYERTDEQWSGYDFVERHGLHAKRIERVRKTTKKILAVLNIKPQNIVIQESLPDEDKQLRDDFTSGFLDFIYEDIGTARGRATIYRNIHGNSESTTRTISDRSAARIDRKVLVAGVPRWYLKGRTKDGRPIKHDILDTVFPVDSSVIGAHAMNNGLVQKVWASSRMVGDMVVDLEQGRFGSLVVGSPKKGVAHEAISQHSQAVLLEHVLTHPGRVQRALRTLAEQLGSYRQRIPEEVLFMHRVPDAPDDVTQEWVTEVLKGLIQNTATAHDVDDKLAALVYSDNITLEQYYGVESIATFDTLSPQEVEVAGERIHIHYDQARPYATKMQRRQLIKINQAVYLPDGREVLYQRPVSGGGKERVSFAGAIARNILR